VQKPLLEPGQSEAIRTAKEGQPMKAFVIVRVSSQDQLRGYGPDVQWQDDIIPNAQLLGLEVSEQYRRVIQEPATTWDRPKYEALIKEALALYSKGEIQALLFPRQDRESRFVYASFPLLVDVIRAGIKIFFAREQFELDPNNPESTERYFNKVQQSQSYVETMRINTVRGKKAKARKGLLNSGGYKSTFGYDFIKKSGNTDCLRVINETEAPWVDKIFRWLVYDGLSTWKIAEKLRKLKVPTKRGGVWQQGAVLGIVKNSAYCGKTFAYLETDRIELLPNASPAIISIDLYEAAQRQLRINKAESKGNMKHNYLLHSHIKCKECGRAYFGRIDHWHNKNGERMTKQRYYCSGMLLPSLSRCHNKSWLAEELESKVWEPIERIIRDPETILNEVNKRINMAGQLSYLEDELKQTERRLKALDREQLEQLKYAKMGFPEETIITENKRINSERANLKSHELELEAKIKACQVATDDIPRLEEFVKKIQAKLGNLNFERRRLVLDALGITIWINHDDIEITGSIGDDIVIPQSW
jgi:site-specific DNA recombinase